jgi:hypothetical protein
MNNAPSLASAVYYITNFIIDVIVKLAPLLGEDVSLFDRKNHPPAWLHDFFLFT